MPQREKENVEKIDNWLCESTVYGFFDFNSKFFLKFYHFYEIFKRLKITKRNKNRNRNRYRNIEIFGFAKF